MPRPNPPTPNRGGVRALRAPAPTAPRPDERLARWQLVAVAP